MYLYLCDCIFVLLHCKGRPTNHIQNTLAAPAECISRDRSLQRFISRSEWMDCHHSQTPLKCQHSYKYKLSWVSNIASLYQQSVAFVQFGLFCSALQNICAQIWSVLLNMDLEQTEEHSSESYPEYINCTCWMYLYICVIVFA